MGCSSSKQDATGRDSLSLWFPTKQEVHYKYIVVEDEEEICEDLVGMIVDCVPDVKKSDVYGFNNTDSLVQNINEISASSTPGHPNATRFIVFMDMRLRSSYGGETVTLLTPAAHQVTSPVACIAATAFHEQRDCITYKEKGCVSVLCKPYNQKLVKSAIDHVKRTPMFFKKFED